MTPKMPWTEHPERGSIWIMHIFLAVINILGHRVASAMLPPIAFYFFLTGSRSRKASRDYLSKLHQFRASSPRPNLLNIYLHHLEFGRAILDRVFLWQGKLTQFHVTHKKREMLDKKGAKGALLVGAHLGSFDVLRVLALDLDTPVNVVMHRSHAPQINKIFQKLNPNTNLHVIESTASGIDGILKLKECVEKGQHIALPADRQTPGQEKRICKVPFLGEKAPFPQGPWILARMLGCRVILVLALRTGPRTYRLVTRPLADAVQPFQKHDENCIRGQVALYAKHLEELCCEYPMQWFNFYDFWNSAA